MNILVIGCGKVGKMLAETLSKKGHDISLVDKIETNFDTLSSDFTGFTTVGVPIDQDVLRRAGIESCDALCAMSNNDNVNIMVAQLATTIFNVEKVLVRVFDPNRGEVFAHFGLQTVCPTNLTVTAVCAALEETADKEKTLNFDNHTVKFTTLDCPKEFVGMKSSEIEYEPREVLFAVIHEGSTMKLSGQQDIEFFAEDKLVFAKII